MNILEQYHGLALEFQGLQNRVRNLIGNAHWLSDGEWKESILRQALRGSMPQDLHIGRGFVCSANAVSRQIDVLISPTSTPSLFRDGDFNIVSPAGLLGALEVKTTADAATFRKGVTALTDLARLIGSKHTRTGEPRKRFYGFFAYESSVTITTALQQLQRSAAGNERYVLDFVCLGARRFILWDDGERAGTQGWQAYEFHDDRAVGYFLYNVLARSHPCVEEEGRGIWFPEDGKDAHLVQTARLKPSSND